MRLALSRPITSPEQENAERRASFEMRAAPMRAVSAPIFARAEVDRRSPNTPGARKY